MTPPKIGIALAPEVALPPTDNPLEAKKAEPIKTEQPSSPSNDPKIWNFKATLKLTGASKGNRNGTLLAINNIGQLGDLIGAGAEIAYLKDLIGTTARLRLGPFISGDAVVGRTNTGGANLGAGTVGAETELDWRRAYQGSRFAGPSRLGLKIGIGVGGGSINTDGGFAFHSLTGFATLFGIGANIVNLNVGSVEIGLDFIYQSLALIGSEQNVASHQIGGGLTIRGTQVKAERPCDIGVNDIAAQEEQIKKLEAHNSRVVKELDLLKIILANHPRHPFTQENSRKFSVIGAVVEALNNKGVDKRKIRAVVREGNKAKLSELTGVIAKHTGISTEEANTISQQAKTAYPATYDLWALPLDPEFKFKPTTPNNPKDCLQVKQYHDQLVEYMGKLREQKGALDTHYKHAVHLAGLFIGQADTKEILFATVLNIDTPSFKTARPNAKDMADLESGRRTVEQVEKAVYSVPSFEQKKLDALSKWMNGEGDLPGEERIRKALQESNKDKAGKSTLDESPEAKAAYNKFKKRLGLAILGHTDSRGSDAINDPLSERRAQIVKKGLIARKVADGRLFAKGFGKKYPALGENGLSYLERIIAQGKNRRIEFVPYGAPRPTTPEGSQNPDHLDSEKAPKGLDRPGDPKGPGATAPAGKPTPAAKASDPDDPFSR